MASIYREIVVDAAPEHVWAAVRDVGHVHERVAPGFVVATRMEGDARIVTFADGRELAERIVGIDDDIRRFSYSATTRAHHNASFQVFAHEGGRTKLVWITDVLPSEAAAPIAANMDKGLAIAKNTLEKTAKR
jgi:hypothetical protein